MDAKISNSGGSVPGYPQPVAPAAAQTPPTPTATVATLAPDAYTKTPPLPDPVSTPPTQLPTPDALIKSGIHSAEDGVAKVLDFFGKVPFLRDLGYKVYGLVSGRPAESPTVNNLAGLTPNLYRGAQPSQEGLQTLAKDGVDTVINLRPEAQWEQPMVEQAGMKYLYLPLPPVGPPTNAQAVQFLQLVTDPANGKVFFHCQHGADRTGAMAAAYRIAVQGWTPDQAIAEMYQHHFHDGIENEKIAFVKQFASYWASLPAATRASIIHGTPAPVAADAASRAKAPLPAVDASSPTPNGAADQGGAVSMTAGNSVKLLTDRKNSYQEALNLINSAQQSVQFETFTFNGAMGQGIAQALIAARARGVNVQVVLDPKQLLVSDGKGLKDLLQSHGIDVRVYNESSLNNPTVGIDHAKALLVDAEKALVGDSNFDRYEDYDMDYEVQGPAVPKIQAMLAQSWANAKVTGKLVSDGLPPVQPIPVASGDPVHGGDTSVGITETAPSTDKQVGAQTYQNTLAAIKNSTKSIDVLMYTMSDTGELAALEEAAKRGVQVRVVLSPSKTAYNSKAVRDLEAAGIHVKWYTLQPGMKEMHGKVAVFDGQTVLGGSTNWVHSSAVDNHELGVWMQGPVAQQVEQTFNQIWDNQSTPAHLSMVNTLESYVMNGVSNIL